MPSEKSPTKKITTRISSNVSPQLSGNKSRMYKPYHQKTENVDDYAGRVTIKGVAQSGRERETTQGFVMNTGGTWADLP